MPSKVILKITKGENAGKSLFTTARTIDYRQK